MADAPKPNSYLPMRRVTLCAVIIATLAGCTYYETAPYTPSRPSVFDRSWSAALGAADDVGVALTLADRTSGLIRGTTAGSNVTIRVFTQADGSVRVEISAIGPKGTDTVTAERLSSAYDRRMGR